MFGCTFQGADADLPAEELAIDQHSEALIVSPIFEAPGDIYAVEVSQCINLVNGFVTLDRSWPLPSYVNEATIFSNGFSKQFRNGDHHIVSMFSQIRNISFSAGQLRWQFAGKFQDHNNDDPTRQCWYATIVGWNRSTVPATVSAQITSEVFQTEGDGEVYRTSTAGGCGGSPSAVLSQGFLINSSSSDHHLLQFGFAETQDRDPGSCTIYDSFGILKDDHRRSGLWNSRASVVRGAAVRSWAPSFTITPAKPPSSSGCIFPQGGLRVEHQVRTAVFPYFLPLLSGFNIRYACGDEHVENLGVSIRNIKYDFPSRTLEYDLVSQLGDDNDTPGFYIDANVGLFGLTRPLPPGPVVNADATFSGFAESEQSIAE